MLMLVWVPLVLQLLIPVGLILLIAGRPANRLSWALSVLLGALYAALIAVAGIWLVLPWYLPLGYALGILLAAGRSGRRLVAAPRWPAGWRESAVTGGIALVAGGCVAGLGLAASGRRPPTTVVSLAFPLRRGTYLVVNGGSTELINAHLRTLVAARFRIWRGQSYGVDIVRLSRFGLPAPGLLPRDPAAYAIFGDPVRAPCAGTVVTTLDGVPDMRPPQTDRRHMAGNHVILRCGDAWVVLAHLRQSTVAVHPGEPVDIGALIGRAGNSGNSDEPHLHIHAQRPGSTDAPLSGEPLAIRFGATYPVRNVRLH